MSESGLRLTSVTEDLRMGESHHRAPTTVRDQPESVERLAGPRVATRLHRDGRAGTAAEFDAPHERNRLTDLVYILSSSYSGSTLLTFLLGTHPRVATIGELKATARGNMENYLCSCRVKMLECPFWLGVKSDLAKQGVDLDLHDLGTHFGFVSSPLGNKVLRAAYRGGLFERARRLALAAVPGWRRAFRAIVERNEVMIEAILRRQQGTLFVDGSKDAVRLRYLLDSGRWRIKVLRLIRDGRASASSYMRRHKLQFEEATHEWRHAEEECDRIDGELSPDARLTLRYEALCANPDETLASAFGFLGLDPTLWTKEYFSVEHHILGHASRIHSNGQIAQSEKWKPDWSDSHEATFDRVAGELNRRHGYA